jgi:beta-xylosidase
MRATLLGFAIVVIAACSSRETEVPTTEPIVLPGDPGDAAPEIEPPPSNDAVPEAEPPEIATYENPVLDADLPDPAILRAGDAWYAFGTNGGGRNVPVARSTDLARWTIIGDALPVLPKWARAGASLTWAPGILARGTKEQPQYVLYYTARYESAGFQCISRAVSAAPEGPYVDDSSAPFVCQITQPEALCGSIDPSPFVDGDGRAYLLWKSDENAPQCQTDARLWSAPMTADGLALAGPAQILLTRDRAWESPLIEGPSLVLDQGRYYLFYSANWWESANYAVGYAVCSGPLGPCAKKTLDGPLFAAADPVLGPGGQDFFEGPRGQLFMAYHAWTAPRVGYGMGGRRSLRIERVTFEGGEPKIAGPTTTPQPL